MGAYAQAVLDGIAVEVIEMVFVIALIADRVFPEATLPDVRLAVVEATGGG